MKEYRLLAWPEFPREYRRTAHRRALSDMSLRFMRGPSSPRSAGSKKGEDAAFLEVLDARGVLDERDGTAPDSFFDSIGRLGWFAARPRRPRHALTLHLGAARARRRRIAGQWFSLAWLIEYFGISIVTSSPRHDRLARQARCRLQPPGAVEQIVLGLVGLAGESKPSRTTT